MMRRVPAVVAAAVLALSLAGCSAGSFAASAGDYGAEGGVAPAAVPGPQSYQDSAAGSASGVGGVTVDATRDVIMTGDVTLTVDDPIAIADQVTTIVEGGGGRIDSRAETAATDSDPASAQLLLRIPSAKLTGTLDQIKKLGRADNVTIKADDVTGQVDDVDAHVTALRDSIQTLLGFLKKSTKTSDLIEIEGEISDRQAQLQSYESQQRDLADQVSMASITLELRTEKQAPKVGPDSFWDGVVAGWNAFVEFWRVFSIVIGVLLPWIVLAAVITVGIVLLVRRSHRRAAATAAGQPAPAEQAHAETRAP